MWRFKKIVATLLLGTFAAGEPAAGSQCAERAKRAVD